MGPDVRERVLALLADGLAVSAAAARLGLTHQAVYGAAAALTDFGERIAALATPED